MCIRDRELEAPAQSGLHHLGHLWADPSFGNPRVSPGAFEGDACPGVWHEPLRPRERQRDARGARPVGRRHNLGEGAGAVHERHGDVARSRS
eukprot:4066785-Alexandrium_andersonii.AAC.1